MKKIEAYVDEVYHSVGGNEKEIEDLKAEMKNHLLEAVDELKREGKSENEAVVIAIDRFGGEEEIRSVVGQLFRAQKIFAKGVLCVALTFFVLTSIACGVLWTIDTGDMNENYAVAERIVDMLEGKEVISRAMKKEIDALAQDKNQILNIRVYKMEDVRRVLEDEYESVSYHTNEAIPSYQYENSILAQNWMLIDLGYSIGDTEWYVKLEAKRIFSFILLIALIGFTVYGTLFTIWAIINAYHHRRLNIGWIIAFALLNIIGYLIYFLVGREEDKQY